MLDVIGRMMGEKSVVNGTIAGWLDLSREALDDLYKNAQAGVIPQGETNGIILVKGIPFARELAHAVHLVFWQGKVFDVNPDGKTGLLRNKVTPFGIKLFMAKVFYDKSWLDGKETIVIDYSSTSLCASRVRDEIREVTPGNYLGKAWWGENRVLDFALETML